MINTRSVDDLHAGDVVLLGVPWDRHSSFLRGAAAGPRRIREALAAGSSNLWTETGIDLDNHERVVDAGDEKRYATNQLALIRRRFLRNRVALVGGVVVLGQLVVLVGGWALASHLMCARRVPVRRGRFALEAPARAHGSRARPRPDP